MTHGDLHNRKIDNLHVERARATWDALLRYANAKGPKAASKSLQDAIFFAERAVVLSFSRKEELRPQLERRFEKSAVKSQQDLRDVLAFLSHLDTYRHSQDLARKTCDFLNAHANGKSWSFRPRLEHDEPRGEWSAGFTGRPKYRSIMVPVALFLIEQLSLLGGLSGEDPCTVFPLRQCQRPECGKFMLADRPRRKRYCSNLCGVLDRRRDRSPAEWRDYIWFRRLEKTKGGVRNKKLARPETIARLRAIAEEYPKLAKRAENLLSRNPGKIPS